MDAVKLMDRTDTKFVFSAQQLPTILKQLKNNFRILEVEGVRQSRYETLYFDTPDFQFYHRHQTKKLNRYKVRARKYVESDVNFLEIKFKNIKGRTVKERIKTSEINQFFESHQEEAKFIERKTGVNCERIQPALWVNYNRITLVNNNHSERLTIDVGLNFEWEGEVADYSFLVIAELKQGKAERSVFSGIMKSLFIREGGFSKYCIGIASLHPEIKQNNFKPKFHYINKLKGNVYV
jgi:hypothetical protein